jgi:hypothetical protein
MTRYLEAAAVDGVELLLDFSPDPDFFSPDPDFFSLAADFSVDPDFSLDPELVSELDSLVEDPLVEPGCCLPDSRLSVR